MTPSSVGVRNSPDYLETLADASPKEYPRPELSPIHSGKKSSTNDEEEKKFEIRIENVDSETHGQDSPQEEFSFGGPMSTIRIHPGHSEDERELSEEALDPSKLKTGSQSPSVEASLDAMSTFRVHDVPTDIFDSSMVAQPGTPLSTSLTVRVHRESTSENYEPEESKSPVVTFTDVRKAPKTEAEIEQEAKNVQGINFQEQFAAQNVGSNLKKLKNFRCEFLGIC